MAAIQGHLTSSRTRRVVSITITTAIVIVTWFALEHIDRDLGDVSMASGWTLLAGTAGLYGLSLRKRLNRTALGPVSLWLRVHTYMGLFTLVVFAWHVGWPIHGWFELALASVFLFITCTGIALSIYSRRVPKLLASVRRDYRLEDIPVVQAEIAERAHKMVIQASLTGAAVPLAEFYQNTLLHFFLNKRNWLYRCFPNGNKRRQLLRELDDLGRYLDDAGKSTRDALSQLVIDKDDTDFHRAMQHRLRFLVTCHVIMTWAIVLMIGVHVVLVLRFQGVAV